MFITIIVLALIVLSSCTHSDDDYEDVFISYPFDYYHLTLADKEKYGIDLLYSPDKKSYLYTDKSINFNYIYVVKDNISSVVFDFKAIFGENEVRDMVPLTYAWKDNETIYVIVKDAFPHPSLYEIDIKTKKFTHLSLPVTGYYAGYDQQSSNFLIQNIGDYSARSYTIFNHTSSVQTQLPELEQFWLYENHEQVKLFTFENDQLSIFDFTKQLNFNITIPLSSILSSNLDLVSRISFIPNKDHVALFADHQLIVYDYARNEQLAVINLIGYEQVTASSLLGWSQDGRCFYGYNYIMCPKMK